MQVENSCYLYFLILEAGSEWDGWWCFFPPPNQGSLSFAWPCVYNIFIAMCSRSPSMIEYQHLIFILQYVFFLWNVFVLLVFNTFQFNLVCGLCISSQSLCCLNLSVLGQLFFSLTIATYGRQITWSISKLWLEVQWVS